MNDLSGTNLQIQEVVLRLSFWTRKLILALEPQKSWRSALMSRSASDLEVIPGKSASFPVPTAAFSA
jgi:hypothetical protein